MMSKEKYLPLLLLALIISFPVELRAIGENDLEKIAEAVDERGSSEVQHAFELLVEKDVLKVREEEDWELPNLYPRNEYPEIADALVIMQESRVLQVKPVNWEGTPNTVEILVDKEEIFPRALDMIRRATRWIRFNMFLWGGSIGKKVAHALADAQERGVDVQVIAPEKGGSKALKKLQLVSSKLAGEEPLPPYEPVIEYAKELGLDIGHIPVKRLPGKAFVKADHNKVLTIGTESAKEALIGGMNFADVVANNHDLMLWISGPAVDELNGIFSDNWRHCKKSLVVREELMPGFDGLNTTRGYYCEPCNAPGGFSSQSNCADGRVVISYSNAFSTNTRGMVEGLIASARESIRVQMFTCTDDRLVDALIDKYDEGNGVDVKVILDPNVHAFGLRLMGAPNISTVRQLKKAGIPVRAYKTKPGSQMHIKSLTVDGRYSCFGSTNFTTAGFDSNNETFAKVDSEAVAEKMMKVFEEDWEEECYVIKSDGFGRWILSLVTETLDGRF